ncbi:MAG: VCBS repeat-containing protein, partial [Myxococcaceae bacterium]
GASAELARAVGTLLTSELSARGFAAFPVAAPSPEAAESAARAAGARCLLRLTIGLDHGLLTARGDLLGTRENFWSGATPTRPALPAAVVVTSVDADAHALALAAATLVSPPPVATVPAATGPLKLIGGTFARLPALPAALAAGDLDGDGKHEVAVLTDDEVLLFSPEGRLLARHEHKNLPTAEAPCREPFGALAFQASPPRLLYLSARRGRGESLSYDRGGLRAVGTFDEVPLGFSGEVALTGRMNAGTNTFAPEVSLGGRSPVTFGAPFTTASVRAGAFLFVFPDGQLSISRGGPGEKLRALGAGAGSALADLSGDGQPSLVSSSPRYQVDPDELRVTPLSSVELAASRGGPVDLANVTPAWQGLALRGRVLAIAAADLDGDGADELVLGVWLLDGGGELQVFRRATP